MRSIFLSSLETKRISQATIIWTFCIGLLITFFIFILFLRCRPNWINMISILGTYASLFGIFLGVVQILNVKESIKFTNAAVSQTIAKIDRIYSISELSAAIKLVEEIEAYLLSHKYEMSLVRIKDLKKIVIEYSYNFYELNKCIPIITSDVSNLTNFVFGGSRIKIPVIIDNLENISSILIKINTTLNPLNNGN